MPAQAELRATKYVASFLGELPDIAPTPTVLILDDFHVADGSGDVSLVAKSLVTRSPERLTIVISSRRVPEIAVGRLRAQGELVELRSRDLQFSETEIADLFRSELGQSLDRESLGLLNRRSEGWAASLQLIRTGLRDRTPIETREFIRALSGEQAELYDYLAEEVVGDLRPSHQDFLMRTSILPVVSVDSAAAICDENAGTIQGLVDLSERLGLISRHSSASGGYRYHPLVRDFLESRLRSTIGDAAVTLLHETAGAWAESRDWRVACHHYEAAGDISAVHRVLDDAIDSIAGQGDYAAAADYLRRFTPRRPTASFEIISSRMEFRLGNIDAAIHHATRAVQLRPDMDAALSNSIAMHGHVGNHESSWKLAIQLEATASSSLYGAIAKASRLAYEASLDGSLGAEIEALRDLAARSEAEGLTHFAGVSHLNISLAERARGNAEVGFDEADLATSALIRTYGRAELASAYLSRAAAAAQCGDLQVARTDIEAAAEAAPFRSRGEWLVESADIEAAFGSAQIAESYLAETRLISLVPATRELARTVEARLALRRGDTLSAEKLAGSFDVGKPTDQPGFKSRQLAIIAHAAVASRADGALRLVDTAIHHAEMQGSVLWQRYAQFLTAVQGPTPPTAIGALIQRTPDRESWVLDSFAELICVNLEDFDAGVRGRVAAHCSSRPERWRPALRAVVADSANPSRWSAGTILDEVGTNEDVPILRSLARSARGSSDRKALGRSLARRLAPRFLIDDLGRVEVRSGAVGVPPSSIRRKVLAMLCYLLTRPRFSATRDEVVDALWPDLSPEVAVNSLNQTVYFLRRVFEPDYKEDLSAGYVHHGSDVLWLDRELVSSRSSKLSGHPRNRSARDPDPAARRRVSARYIATVSRLTSRTRSGRFRSERLCTSPTCRSSRLRSRATWTADTTTGRSDSRDVPWTVDPTVESLEISLLRLYRATVPTRPRRSSTRTTRAVLKEELGVEPPPLDVACRDR